MPSIRLLGLIAAPFIAMLSVAPNAGAGDRAMDLDPQWEYVADTVMGGVSRGTLATETVDGRTAGRLSGDVSLDNNGGFIQMAFEVTGGRGIMDMSAWTGVELDVYGNGETYDLRVRTDQLTRPWQSYRASFVATRTWTTIRIPFADLVPHKTETTFDARRVRRIGVLAIGRAFAADVAVAGVRLYR